MPDIDPLPIVRAARSHTPPEIHSARTVDERLDDLELVVFGNERQRIKGLIDSLAEVREGFTSQLAIISDDVKALKDNRAYLLQMAVQLATLAGTALALYLAIRKP